MRPSESHHRWDGVSFAERVWVLFCLTATLVLLIVQILGGNL